MPAAGMPPVSVASSHAVRQLPAVLARIPRVDGESTGVPPTRDSVATALESGTHATANYATNYAVDSSHAQADRTGSRRSRSQSARRGVQSRQRGSVERDSLLAESPPFTTQQQAKPTAGSDFASQLCRLHSTLAPFAGLIVAIALVMSAGLLYWLVLSPAGKPFEYQDAIEQETLGQFSTGWPVAEPPAAAPSAETAEVSDEAVAAWLSSTQRRQITRPAVESPAMKSGVQAFLRREPAASSAKPAPPQATVADATETVAADTPPLVAEVPSITEPPSSVLSGPAIEPPASTTTVPETIASRQHTAQSSRASSPNGDSPAGAYPTTGYVAWHFNVRQSGEGTTAALPAASLATTSPITTPAASMRPAVPRPMVAEKPLFNGPGRLFR